MTDPIDVVRAMSEAAKEELRRLTSQLYRGEIAIAQWEVSAAGLIKDAHVAGGILGAGSVDVMGPAQYGRIGGNLADEYRYLHDFAEQMAAKQISEAQALSRIGQYADASQQSYWNSVREFGPSGDSSLPLLTTSPGDGSTRCRGNCQCEIVIHDDGSADVVLGAGESCEDCVARAAGGPYRLS